MILLVGVYGCLHCVEIERITIDDTKEEGSLFHIQIPITKYRRSTSFIIPRDVSQMFKKYILTRSEIKCPQRFFLQYQIQNGKCLRTVRNFAYKHRYNFLFFHI